LRNLKLRWHYELAFPEWEHQKVIMLLVSSIYWKSQWKKGTQLSLEVFEITPAIEEIKK